MLRWSALRDRRQEAATGRDRWIDAGVMKLGVNRQFRDARSRFVTALVRDLQIFRADWHFGGFSWPRVSSSLVIVATIGTRITATTRPFSIGAQTDLLAK